MNRFSFLILMFVLMVIFGNTANAYTETNTGLPMVLELTPAEPGPNQKVSAVLKSYSFDLNAATIDWKVNGAAATTDKKSTAITFTTGSIGSVTVLDVSAVLGTDKNQKTITIRPASVNLVWQADSLVPKGYRGKPLAVSGGEVTIIALPNFIGANGSTIKPEELIYEWEKDYQRIANLSGLGKNTFKIIAGTGGTAGVRVSTADKKISAVNSIQIVPATPKVVFYENHPLNGLMANRALVGQYELESNEITLAAEPFYFSPENLRFNWALNRRAFTPNSSLPNQALFGRPTSGSGQAQVGIEIVNPNKTAENASSLLNILFGDN